MLRSARLRVTVRGWQPTWRRAASTFVSRHVALAPEISAFLERQSSEAGGAYRTSGAHYILRECPLCAKGTGGKADNEWKLYIHREQGAYFCHRCGAGGSWWDFKRKLGHLPAVDALPPPAHASAHTARVLAEGPSAAGVMDSRVRTVDAAMALSARDDLLRHGTFPEALHYLTHTRKLSPTTLWMYGVGAVRRPFVSEPGATPDVGEQAANSEGAPLSADAQALGLPPHATTPRGSSMTWHTCITFPWLQPCASTAATASSMHAPLRAAATILPALPGADGSLPPPAGALHTDVTPDTVQCGRLKLRSITDKSKQLLVPRGGAWGWFGLHTVPADARSVVITEGELDAMSVAQATAMPAISLPNGCRSLPVELLPDLERFEKIYLWMDDDVAGREGAQKIAAKLGLGRCYIVRPPRVPQDVRADASGAPLLPPKDANEALQRGLDLSAALAAAAPQPHDQIVSFEELRPAVLREVAASLGLLPTEPGERRAPPSGVPFRSLPSFQRLVKGHRAGELTILTGPTGSGKTTLLTQLSLDLAVQGVRTLWGSFEVKSTRLIASMLHQLQSGRIPLDAQMAAELSWLDTDAVPLATGAAAVAASHVSSTPGYIAGLPTPFALQPPGVGGSVDTVATLRQLERAADVMSQLPLYYLRFFGSTDVDRVVDALEYASYVHDIDHVILDNLQFMMSSSTVGRGFDRFDQQEKALDKFRAFATKHDVHLTLVIHPRKEPEDVALNLSSVFGSAKATQEADTVVILQRTAGGDKYLDVRKNRYDGTLGTVPLKFDADAKCFWDDASPTPGTVIASQVGHTFAPRAPVRGSASGGGPAGLGSGMRAGAISSVFAPVRHSSTTRTELAAADSALQVRGAAGSAATALVSPPGLASECAKMLPTGRATYAQAWRAQAGPKSHLWKRLVNDVDASLKAHAAGGTSAARLA